MENNSKGVITTASTNKTSVIRRRIAVLLLIVIILMAVSTCAAMAFRYLDSMTTEPASTPSMPQNPFISAPAPSGSVIWPPKTSVLPLTERAPDSYLDETVWVGDSRVLGLTFGNQIKLSNAFAQTGLCHSNIRYVSCVEMGADTYTIPQAVGIRKPKRMVIAFGINGIAWMDIDTFIKTYASMVELLQQKSPDSTIILQAILPVGSSYEQIEPQVTNQKIDEYNQRLKALAEEMDLYYLETDTAMKDADGSLLAAYDNGDGLHYNTTGSRAILDYFMTHQTS